MIGDAIAIVSSYVQRYYFISLHCPPSPHDIGCGSETDCFSIAIRRVAHYKRTAGSLWISYLFEGRPAKLYFINGGYHIVQYTLYRHAVSGTSPLYRGESIYSWNSEAETVSYVYWNTFGGVSTGTATPDAGKLVFPDETYKGPGGQAITVSSFWENISADSYEQLSVETSANGHKVERRIRFEKRPFTDNPADGF